MSTFSQTKSAVIIPAVVGSTSFFCSLLLITTIIRSKQNTCYHRIIFFLSFWDAFVSFALAIITLPMPEGELTDGLKGPKIGNQYTCEAQVFIIYLSWGYTISANLFLNVYYLCTIRYNVNNVKFRAYAEPAFILLSTTFSLVMPIYFLKHGAFGADQNLETYCTMTKIDDATHFNFLEYYSISFLGSLFIVILGTMVLIISTVWKRGDSVADAELEDFTKHQRYGIAFQAALYVFSFLITWVFTIITIFIRDSPSLEAARYIFMPSQGIFNLIIFMMHKVHSARANENEDENLTTWQTIYSFFKNPEKFRDRHMIANMELIENDMEKIRSERTMQPIDIIGLRRSGMQTKGGQTATSRKDRVDDDCLSFPSKLSEDCEYDGLSNLLDLSFGVSSNGISGPPSVKQDIVNDEGREKVYKNVTFNKDVSMVQDSYNDVMQKQQKKVSHQSEEESVVSSLSKDVTVSGRAKM